MKNAPSAELNGKMAARDGSFRMKTILVPVDFSKDAMRAFRYATQLAEKTGGKVIALNVVENPLVYPAFASGDQEKIANDAQYKLYQACRADTANSEDVETMVRIGVESIPEEIVVAARDVMADLIVLSAHHRALLGHTLFANTADKIARRAPCPVLMVPA
jgi:nucleotide-binding universal stress UspA family protein